MKCDVHPKYWDIKTGKATGRTAEAVKINSLVDNTKAAIHRIYRNLQERDNYVTAERLRNVFLGTEIKQQTLLELFDRQNRERKLLIGVSICQTNHSCYVRTHERLIDFLWKWYNLSDIPLREIDHKFICDFQAYLVTNYGLAHNTQVKYLSNLRYIIGVAIGKDYISKNPFINFSTQYQNSNRGFLTQDEVEVLIAFRFKEEELEQARDIFLFCCFTGLSYSDVAALSREHIQLSFGGKTWIKSRRQKTDTEYNIPLLSIPQLILEKYAINSLCGKVLPVPDYPNYRNRLKKIAEICGIDKNITSHLARHTFATTIALTKGVPIETVSKMLGHTSIKTTQIYAKVISSKIGSDMDLLAEKLSGMEEKMAVNF